MRAKPEDNWKSQYVMRYYQLIILNLRNIGSQ